MRRSILVPLTIFGILLALVAFYLRMRTAQQLDLALSIVDASPQEAFLVLEPLLNRKGVTAFGRVESAQNDFVSRLYDRCIAGMKKRPPQAADFRIAQETLAILQRMGSLGVPQVSVYIRNILQAARDAVPSLEDAGGTDSWQAMRAMFNEATARDLIPADSKDSFAEWLGSISMPDRQASVTARDAVRQAQDFLNAGLTQTGFPPGGAGGSVVSVFPAKFSDDSARALYLAIGMSNQSLTDHYRHLAIAMPEHLRLVHSLLTYDYSALMIHQLAILKGTPGRRRSAFVATCTIEPSHTTVPDPDQLFELYIARTSQSLWDTFQDIGQGFAPDDAAAASALRVRNQVLLDRILGAPEGGLETQYRQIMDWLGARANKSPLSAAIEKSLRERPDAILIIADLSSLSTENPAEAADDAQAKP